MGISQYSMYDVSTRLAGTYGVAGALKAENSTSRPNNTELDMTDFLQLMIVQLQSQTLDDTMDTSEMMNQMVQMQMVTALTNMTETNIMTYASSMVGKDVTIGIINGNKLEEKVVNVIGTGMSNGQYVIFGKDEKGNVETYNLSQIMAVGLLPPKDDEGDTDTTTKPTTPVDPTQPGTTTPGDTEKPGDTTEPTEPTEPSDEGTQIPGDATDKPVDNIDGAGEDTDNSDESTEGTVTPTEPAE